VRHQGVEIKASFTKTGGKLKFPLPNCGGNVQAAKAVENARRPAGMPTDD
jgi:hypothetical protein